VQNTKGEPISLGLLGRWKLKWKWWWWCYVLFCIRLHFSLYCSWHKSTKSCQSTPKCRPVVLMLQRYIPYNGIGTYCKTIHTNSAKYGLTFALSASEKNFSMSFTEIGISRLVRIAAVTCVLSFPDLVCFDFSGKLWYSTVLCFHELIPGNWFFKIKRLHICRLSQLASCHTQLSFFALSSCFTIKSLLST